ncbi:MAG TPA: HD domain-containing phosphohydrolase, partial [Pyrinomonadaceae bacterium]|nr:HD domain-containing phosphohydrolase [Pyrinomonadaceae bacterium]
MSTTLSRNSTLLLLCAAPVCLLVLVWGAINTLSLPLSSPLGLWSFVGITLLSVITAGFSVAVTGDDRRRWSHKSVADAFVLLAIIMYSGTVSGNAGPAVILAGLTAVSACYGRYSRRAIVGIVCVSVISTLLTAWVYAAVVDLFAGSTNLAGDSGIQFKTFLFPLLLLAALQYFLSTVITAWFLSFEAGEFKLLPSPESIVWTGAAQLAALGSAVLIYSAIQTADVLHAFTGVLTSAIVYLLYHFNEKRLDEVRRAEAERRRHSEEMATIHMNTIESLAIAIDAKDQTTHGHVRRTQIYAEQMGKLLKVSQLEVQALLAGALLHDIGKLAVPEYILNKPGKLTEAEFAKMKIHPTVGGDILKRVNFPYPVEDIVRYHHEKWDGSGYPKGLKGEAIPLTARIISVVDFYDATRCDRPYRKGMKREDSLALLRGMIGSAFDPKVVQVFIDHVEEFDCLINAEDIQEQVPSEIPELDLETKTRPDAGLASDVMGTQEERVDGFRSISDAQREVFALHEIAQTIGSSLNLSDTVALVSNKLRAIVPFDSCVIFVVDERSGKAVAAHAAGDHHDVFSRRKINIGEGITGWVVANSRSMCNASAELDLVGVPDSVAKQFRGILVSPLLREDGAFGAIALYSKARTSYTTEHVRLLESVCQHASSALNNALTYEKTKESALVDPLTDLPNARGFYMMLEQKIAECQRLKRESLAVISMDLDEFKAINDRYGHSTGDRLLASIAGVIRRELRQMDILTRYAGDEFVAIMPMASNNMAQSVGERMRNTVEEQLFSVRPGT